MNAVVQRGATIDGKKNPIFFGVENPETGEYIIKKHIMKNDEIKKLERTGLHGKNLW